MIVATVVAMAGALPALAQYTQYTPPGDSPFREVPSLERLEQAWSESLWQAGAIHLDPWIGIRDATWTDNAFGVSDEFATESDLTITAGAGLRTYIRLGSNTMFTAHALPEYVWWRNTEDRNVLNGRYGIGVFGEFSRLKFQATATTGREQQYLSSEVEQLLNVKSDRVGADLDLVISGGLSVFVGGSTQAIRYREDDVTGPEGERLLGLDRDEDRLTAGLRFAFNDRLSIDVGAESSDVAFERPQFDRSNSGVSPLVRLSYAGSRLEARALWIGADFEPEGDSLFVPFDDPLGRFEVVYTPGARLKLDLYGSVNLVYSTIDVSPYYQDQRIGIGASYPLNRRMDLRAYFERGSNDYQNLDGSDAGTDLDRDLDVAGLRFSTTIYQSISARVDVTNTNYDLATGGSRSVTRISVGLANRGLGGSWW
jgi:hypothetical protein